MVNTIKGLKAKALKSKRWLHDAKLTYTNLLTTHSQVISQLEDTKQEDETLRLKEEVNALDAALEKGAKIQSRRMMQNR